MLWFCGSRLAACGRLGTIRCAPTRQPGRRNQERGDDRNDTRRERRTTGAAAAAACGGGGAAARQVASGRAFAHDIL